MVVAAPEVLIFLKLTLGAKPLWSLGTKPLVYQIPLAESDINYINLALIVVTRLSLVTPQGSKGIRHWPIN